MKKWRESWVDTGHESDFGEEVAQGEGGDYK